MTFWTGLVAGWDAFVGFWSGVLVVVGVLLPWLVTAGIITVVIVYLVRWSPPAGRAAAAAGTPGCRPSRFRRRPAVG